jgi:hypothetical protein
MKMVKFADDQITDDQIAHEKNGKRKANELYQNNEFLALSKATVGRNFLPMITIKGGSSTKRTKFMNDDDKYKNSQTYTVKLLITPKLDFAIYAFRSENPYTEEVSTIFGIIDKDRRLICDENKRQFLIKECDDNDNDDDVNNLCTMLKDILLETDVPESILDEIVEKISRITLAQCS